MKFFKDKEEADEAGVAEDEQVTLHWRTPQEKAALELALEHGNRAQRRQFKFGSRTANERDGKDAGAVDISRAERNRRNAQRRTAKKSRRTNR